MRVRKSLYITIITLLMTLSGPLQAVTASQLSEKDNNQPTTTMQLPNEGRSDLQELIQRVDANVGDDSAEEPSSETEADEHEEVEPPIEDSNLPEPEEQGNQKSVVQAKAPRAITTNTNGTSTWTFDSTTGLLSFGTGQLAERIDNNLTNAGVTPANVKTIRFNGAVDAPTAVDYLFANLTQLSGFTSLNNFSTRYATSMSMWFDGTSSLSTLDLSSWNVTRVTSFEYMFYGATSLTTLNLSDWGVGRIVTDVRMGSMFRDTSALTNLNLTNFKTTNVISMTSMFNNTGLTSLDLSSWDVTKVWGFHSMFSNATKLTTLNLSSWGVGRTATGVNMMYMFGSTSTSALTNLNLTNFETTNVIDMSYMFQKTALTSLDLSSWDVTQVTNFYYMFYSTTSLTTLNLSSWGVGRTATNVNMGRMFQDASALTNLSLTDFKTTNVIDMSYMFYRTGLNSLDLSSWDVTQVTSFYYMFYSTTSLTTLNLSSWGVGRTATNVDMGYMFGITSALTNLNLTNFKTTNVIDMNNMFRSTALTSLDLSGWDVTKVTDFDGMFRIATSLTTLNLSSWGVGRTATNVDMGYIFNRTSALTNLNLTNFKTTNVIDMSGMFQEAGLTSLDLSSWDVTQVTSFSGMFSNTTSLTTLNLTGWGVSRTATDVTMRYMFSSTGALTNLNLTNFKTTNVTNMLYMFYKTGLTSLDLSGWDVTKVTDFNGMFRESSLRILNLSGWNSSGSSVSSMFYKTTNLWKITLGEDIIFSSNPEFQAAPAIGTTIPGTSYKTTAASWQIVGTGTALNPKGAMVTTTEMYADRTEPVTYVWANKALAPTPVINTISSLTFGTLAASDFFNGNSPLATNMATGSVALEDLDNSTTYNVTVAQTSDWTTDGESATIAKSNLKIKYGANDLSTGASSFWSGTSATETKSIAFNHDDTKNFSIWLNPSAVLDTALLGKQLESELTWTLSETP
ncbi:BspA family leucine-rich repeat surface protein [Leuconostoc falkenbergense]|uniref:BspA family leucine-rich repeat surface protein n=1 Tax=Leuconostoc falkenbergense TaxID=2766470 RepID=UPI002A806197|nr:BspA family leucine-rich repeat surface protein [Leuconostoc falkenbergense]MDY5163638.1 BspA family leucine-rich repeat surface protein [Leuconostoc falkenbergense]